MQCAEEMLMFPVWVYFVVALGIALVAFAIEQLASGIGMVFVAFTSIMWTSYSISRAKRRRRC